uniref:Reverse transcriptase/retrotransposon-derived protein RNase H-like domain-containing protein n=1 Tax=Oryzias latipes TaxID=8090 RepID=A0A3P9K4S7_ORYLA
MTQTTHDLHFYGHPLTEDGLLPSEDKLQAMKDIQAPTSTKELQTLLGMMTYLNRFSTKLAELVAPLRELNKKNVHFRWEPHHQQALDDIKKELCSKQLISYYDSDPNTVTILQCDASTLGLGAWIRQIDQHGQEKIVGMASRCLIPTESRYSNIERECLAVMFGLEKFKYYLLGRQVMVETDHSPLEQIFKKNLAEHPQDSRDSFSDVLNLTLRLNTNQGVQFREQMLCHESAKRRQKK